MFLAKIKRKFELGVIKSIDLDDMSLDFTLPDPWVSTLASDRMTGRLTAIPGFNWPIQQVKLKDNGVDIGHLDPPFAPASVRGGIITSSLSKCTMHIVPQSHAAFAHFVAALTTKAAHTFSIKGNADIIFNLGRLGIHTLHGIDFSSDLTLRGLANLPNITCKSAVIVQNTEERENPVSADTVAIQCQFDMQNPSQLSLILGDLILATSVEGNQHVGMTTLESFSLKVGMNSDMHGKIVLDTTIDAAKSLVKALEVQDQRVYLKGFRGTSKNEALSAGLVTLFTSVVLPRFVSAT
ncbi:hypothetical protein CPC16_011938 [Podila verticillata]|uniref:Uncharacterized protein n=1 Tax=Podila verticillata NRRL 6337 TaxID=1069443 RepID=A0A086TIQ3_9FUNG|nr:hypothetical protein BGZ52_005817 [Haplosporangium bisporale]KAF9214972.1 hypothetical protein BGZ59_002577 [Podila verticillata]KAF9394235.1 hypothetical protein CPC16_011938 [Podila verticillata]KFH61830.1 hypothetical protein MVEG_12339 [Podila verticillata NRRL 6337]